MINKDNVNRPGDEKRSSNDPYSDENLNNLMTQLEFRITNLINLKTAITTKAAQNEHHVIIPENNERLAFLGDSVLKFALSKILFDKSKSDPEKYSKETLTKKRVILENNEKLAEIARKLEIKQHLFLGNDENNPNKKDVELLATALEAIIGAIHLEKEDEKYVDQFVGKIWRASLEELDESLIKDPLSQLNEEVQKKYKNTPEYCSTDIGDENTPIWKVELKINGIFIAEYEDTSKKEAKLKTAIYALQHRENW